MRYSGGYEWADHLHRRRMIGVELTYKDLDISSLSHVKGERHLQRSLRNNSLKLYCDMHNYEAKDDVDDMWKRYD